jgi:hypothetical protein
VYPGLAALVLAASPSPSPSPSAPSSHGVDWGNVPAWLALIVATAAATVGLLQLRQQANTLKGEVERNKCRDKLLDGQLRELRDRANDRSREQAEQIQPDWYSDEVVVRNDSSRPITRLAISVVRSDDHGGHTTHHACGWYEGLDISDLEKRTADKLVEGAVLPVLRPGRQAVSRLRAPAPPPRITSSGEIMPALVRIRLDDSPPDQRLLRFNDDAGRRWQLDEYQHLERARRRRLVTPRLLRRPLVAGIVPRRTAAIQIQAGAHTITAADPMPSDLQEALIKIKNVRWTTH